MWDGHPTLDRRVFYEQPATRLGIEEWLPSELPTRESTVHCSFCDTAIPLVEGPSPRHECFGTIRAGRVFHLKDGKWVMILGSNPEPKPLGSLIYTILDVNPTTERLEAFLQRTPDESAL